MTGTERRRTARRVPEFDEPLSRVRLRAGRELVVINLSNSGAMVRSMTRLLPGHHVEVHVVTRDGRELVRSRVAWCRVASVEPEEVAYLGGLAFEHLVDTSPPAHDLPAGLAVTEAGAGAVPS